MLYVFHVDTGTMVTFDMNVAMQRSVSTPAVSIQQLDKLTFAYILTQGVCSVAVITGWPATWKTWKSQGI